MILVNIHEKTGINSQVYIRSRLIDFPLIILQLEGKFLSSILLGSNWTPQLLIEKKQTF